jgi:hypothetical protein
MNMRPIRLLLTSAVVLFAFGSVGCTLQIEKTFAMQPGSGIDMYFTTYDEPPVDIFEGRIELNGGTVMTIDLSTSLLDYLDGTVNGQVTVDDVLFSTSNLIFFGFNLGPMCIALSGPSGGSFEYRMTQQTAAFDVVVDTSAELLDKTYAAFIGSETIPFPFHLAAEMPLGLVDALGLFTGTSEMTVTQPIDERIIFGEGTTDLPLKVHMLGSVTLMTQDTFPTSPLLEQCLALSST